MNKTELVAAVAKKSGLSKKDADKAVSAIIEIIVKTVKKGDKVQLIGFGTFSKRHRNKRSGRDPRTGKPITIPARDVPAFTAGAVFKKAVGGR